MSGDSATSPQPAVEAAYVSAAAGIAAPWEGDSAAPDQIYVEFSRPVVVDGPADPLPADGFTLDGTFAGLETLEPGETDGASGDDGPGSRVLVLTLSQPITPEEHPALSYTPRTGNVRTPDGTAVAAVDGVDVAAASPRVEEVSLAAEREAVRVVFDAPVRSRTGDAAGFSLVGDASLAGDARVDGRELTLPLDEPLSEEPADEPPSLRYRAASADTEQPRSLVGEDGVPVGAFELRVDAAEGPKLERVWVPEGGPRDRVLVLFDRPVTVEGSDDLTLENTPSSVGDSTSCDDLDSERAPRAVTLNLTTPLGEPPVRLAYGAEEGFVHDEAGRPAEPFTREVEVTPPAPAAEAVLAPSDRPELRVRYDREVTLSMDDATGFALSYDGDTDSPPTLTGAAHAEGTEVVLETTDPVDPELNPKIDYQAGDGTLNVVGVEAGVTADSVAVRVADDTEAAVAEPADDEPDLLGAEIPARRDRIVCTFDATPPTDASAFGLSGTDVSLTGVVTSGPEEVTLELDAELPAGETPVVTFQPPA